jgi:APA family basic amino acid/polyamine antiporter
VVPAHRPLGTVHATALVIANMVGTGVFTTTGIVLPYVRSPVLVLAVWAVAGVLGLCGAAVYAELGAMMPRAGGEYVYLTRAFHPAAGFLAGWIALLVGFVAPTAAGAIAFGRYVHTVFPGLPSTAAALVLLAGLTIAHMVHVGFGARMQTAVTAFVIGLILAFVAAAVVSGHGNAAHLSMMAPVPTSGSAQMPVGAGALALGLITVGYAYFGWNSVSYVAGEVRDPVRTLPWALVAGTAAVTLLYLALNLVFLWSAPPAALSGRVEVAFVAAGALFGPRGAVWMSSLVALAVAGCVSAMVMAGSRITVAMADDGALTPGLARRNRLGAPTTAVALQGTLAAVTAATVELDTILVYVGFTLNLVAGAAVVALGVLRRRHPDAERPHRALGWPLSGALFVALVAAMTVFAIRERPRESAAGLATLAGGGLAYASWRRRVARRTSARG